MMCRCCGVIIVPSGGDEAVLVECARTVVALGSPPWDLRLGPAYGPWFALRWRSERIKVTISA